MGRFKKAYRASTRMQKPGNSLILMISELNVISYSYTIRTKIQLYHYSRIPIVHISFKKIERKGNASQKMNQIQNRNQLNCLWFSFIIHLFKIVDIDDRDNPSKIEHHPDKIQNTSIWIRCTNMDHKRLSANWRVCIWRSCTTTYYRHRKIFNWTISTAFHQRKFMFYSYFPFCLIWLAVYYDILCAANVSHGAAKLQFSHSIPAFFCAIYHFGLGRTSKVYTFTPDTYLPFWRV